MLVLVLMAWPGGAGCSKAPEQSVAVVTVDAVTPPPPGGVVLADEADAQVRTDAAEVEETSVRALVQQTKQVRSTRVYPGETLRLFSEWSGIPMDELKLINNGKPPQFGQNFTLSLTTSEYQDFENRRKEYWKKKKKDMYDKFDIKLVEYIVKKGDTLQGIAEDHGIRLWFLMVHNEALDPYHLSPGTKLIVPVLKERPQEAPPEAGKGAEKGDKGEKGKGKGGPKGVVEGVRRGFPVVVKKGETLGLYARWGQTSVEEILKANPWLKSANTIRVGDTIYMPVNAEQWAEFQKLRKKGLKEEKPEPDEPKQKPMD
jgi:LysM repeat protein